MSRGGEFKSDLIYSGGSLSQTRHYYLNNQQDESAAFEHNSRCIRMPLIMRILQLRAGPVKEPTFRSLSEAIAARPARRGRSEKDSALLFDGIITAGYWTDGAVEFEITGVTSQRLRIFASNGVANWQIEPGPASERVLMPVDTSITQVRFSENHVCTWDRSRLMNDRIGRRMLRIWATDTWLFLYVKERPILLFAACEEADTGRPVLRWDETE
jgi:hypothetical protein